MKVLLTGHRGYIGSVMSGILQRAGHDVTGLDADFFRGCDFGPAGPAIPSRGQDVRNVEVDDLCGFDAVIHLAALSNDPLGCLDEARTYEINHHGSVQLATRAKAAGVSRFLFASSCSLYGAAGDALLDESASFRPVTAYGRSKVLAERDLASLADGSFSPTFLRNATAYGVSPRLRADIVVNNLVGMAYTTGDVLIQSDGTPWRPLVHVKDIARAFLAVLQAPRAAVHNEAFNVGGTQENYTVRDVAEIVRAVVPGCSIRYAEGAGPDPRCYRVSCHKLRRHLPEFETEWNVRRGVEELYESFVRYRLTSDMFRQYVRLTRIQEFLANGRLDSTLRWSASTVAVRNC
jgi:nucleoside-diphosphate-sugar epimerase